MGGLAASGLTGRLGSVKTASQGDDDGGGPGTVHVTLPLTGDGSSGSPIAIPAATSSQDGYMTAVNQSYLDFLAFDWPQVQERFLLSKVPELTRFAPFNFGAGLAGLGATWPGGPSVEGAAVQSNNYLTTPCCTLPKTGKIAFSILAQLAVPGTNEACVVALANQAATHSISFLSYLNAATGNSTNYALRIIGGATTYDVGDIANDGGWHWFGFTINGSKVRLYVDGVDTNAELNCSLIATDEALALQIVSSVAGAVKVQSMLMGNLGIAP